MSLAAAGQERLAARPDGAGPHAGGEDTVLHQYLSFHLDGHLYAVPLTQVAEITPFKELNQIPHMPPSVEGLLDHRGMVIPVINLRTRLNLTHRPAREAGNIVLLNLGTGHLVGVLVDAVDAVLSATADQLVQASPLLAGPEGAWVPGFVLQGERIIALVDSAVVTSLAGTRSQVQSSKILDQGVALDRGLRDLIALAPPKTELDSTRIIPQMEDAIAHTEKEMGKVISCVESMLVGSDQAFQALVRLKQEASLGRLEGEEGRLAEIDKVGSALQDRIFDLLQQLQFQDIARQKLERVLNHIQGLQVIVGSKFRDAGKG